MKKIYSLLFSALLAVTPCTTMGATTINIQVDGKTLSFDQPPIIENGRTLVPLRGIFEALGAEVTWNDLTKTAFATKGNTLIFLDIGSTVMHKNGTDIPLDVPAKIYNNRTLVPARAISEALGATVEWNDITKTVSISSNANNPSLPDTNKNIILLEEKATDGTVLVNVSYAYPKTDTAILNGFFSADAIAKSQEFVRTVIDLAKADYEKNKTTFQPYICTNVVTISYDKENTFSYRETKTIHTGDKTTKTLSSNVYNKKTGKILALTDIFPDTQKELDATITQSFFAIIDANPSIFFPDAKGLVKENLTKVGFYLSDNKVTFYFNPGIISPEKYGFVGFTVAVLF